MEFKDSIRQLSNRIDQIKDSVTTEEATKMSLIIPLFQALGYDVFNPNEFCPEYTTDVGIKKGEKVDYAILQDGNPIILIECKSRTENLDKHGSQLFRYFATSPATFGILTNGIIYRFYTDIESENIMDSKPFMEINMLDLRDASINELKKFQKENFDNDQIFSDAAELKYTKEIKDFLQMELEEPSPDFVKYLIKDLYPGQKTQKVIDTYTPIVKRAFSSIINELVNQKLSTALDTTTAEAEKEAETQAVSDSKIVTTEDEINAYFIVRSLLVGSVPLGDISWRDAESYFSVLYADNNRKPICRFKITDASMQISIPNGTADERGRKTFITHNLTTLDDIYQYKDALISVARSYLKNNP